MLIPFEGPQLPGEKNFLGATKGQLKKRKGGKETHRHTHTDTHAHGLRSHPHPVDKVNI